MAHHWGYNDENGPDKWGQWYPVAEKGTRQSPIDLEESKCIAESNLPPLDAKYTPLKELSLSNSGHGYKLDFLPEDSSLTGGPLKAEYKLLGIHTHWGTVAGRGSEHTLDGKQFDGEVHLVHYNTTYNSPEEAMTKSDGLGVLGIFIRLGAVHPEFEKITKHLKDIPFRGDDTVVQEEIDPAQLLPDNDTYFTYVGSLTTPPLLESVTFIIFKTPITISEQQMACLRTLKQGKDADSPNIGDNFRPTQDKTTGRSVLLCRGGRSSASLPQDDHTLDSKSDSEDEDERKFPCKCC